MSLDVYLHTERCKSCGRHDVVFEANITHNLNKMAEEAGIYNELWRPEEIGITKAKQLIEPLEMGIANLEGNPEYFKTLEPANGWGKYENFVPWIKKYLKACKDNPGSIVSVSR